METSEDGIGDLENQTEAALVAEQLRIMQLMEQFLRENFALEAENGPTEGGTCPIREAVLNSIREIRENEGILMCMKAMQQDPNTSQSLLLASQIGNNVERLVPPQSDRLRDSDVQMLHNIRIGGGLLTTNEERSDSENQDAATSSGTLTVSSIEQQATFENRRSEKKEKTD
ncbi:hypothetical protein CAEBREN_03364 [Caenorhabditis brenneri]|uniref:Uncharacterized protein n=1 Tax=Caenorhabditis brenneri TaxID=135651 RepID=G0MHP8_CAEBE|nr:hypothetical protein CAEBREN_03364 [Caenorhabditis brenneri]